MASANTRALQGTSPRKEPLTIFNLAVQIETSVLQLGVTARLEPRDSDSFIVAFPFSPPRAAYENETSPVYLYPWPRAAMDNNGRYLSLSRGIVSPGTSSTRSVSPRLSEAPVSLPCRSLFRRTICFEISGRRGEAREVFELMSDENFYGKKDTCGRS